MFILLRPASVAPPFLFPPLQQQTSTTGVKNSDFEDDGTVESTRRILGLDDKSPVNRQHTTSSASPSSPFQKTNIIGLSYQELETQMKQRKWREDQVAKLWISIYDKGLTDFHSMLELPKVMRQELHEEYKVEYSTGVKSDNISEDGTRKWLFGFNKSSVESVFIPDTQRGTLCVSSQVGCTMSCSFCHTGTQPVERNLTAGEIVGQLMEARSHLMEFPLKTDRVVSNIVFMGQGEPGYNYRNVSKAIDIITDARGCKIGKGRITVSTSGVVPFIKKLTTEKKGITLAISLHAVTDELRDEIVPINRQYPIAELLDAVRPYRRVAFEYVMLKGVNDSPADARELARLVKDIRCVVNLIPFNPWPGSKYECSSREAIENFANILFQEAHIVTPIRWPRGRDILAACGQLRTETRHEKTRGISI